MSKLADLDKIKQNAVKVLGKPASVRWNIFELVNGKRSAPEIATILNKKSTNVSLELNFLAGQGLVEEIKRSGNSIIYQKILELQKINLKTELKLTQTPKQKQNIQKKMESPIITVNPFSKRTQKIIELGKENEIENIDQNWIDALVILNFLETASTKFLMAHGISEEDVKNMKWEQKFKIVESIVFKEAKDNRFTVRTTSVVFFKNYREVRNDQDHVAHLASSRVTSKDLRTLTHQLDDFITIVFKEHKKYCPHNSN